MNGKGEVECEAVVTQAERMVVTSCPGNSIADRAEGTATDSRRTATGGLRGG